MKVIGSVVHVKGAHLTFMGNDAEGLAGGAMYLTSYTQVILSQGSTFDFINNTGRYILAWLLFNYIHCVLQCSYHILHINLHMCVCVCIFIY